MANMWDSDFCGEFKAAMKIIWPIFERGETVKASLTRENYKAFLVCCLKRTRPALQILAF